MSGRQQYLQQYSEEEHLNDLFDAFVENCGKLYAGTFADSTAGQITNHMHCLYFWA